VTLFPFPVTFTTVPFTMVTLESFWVMMIVVPFVLLELFKSLFRLIKLWSSIKKMPAPIAATQKKNRNTKERKTLKK